MNNLIEKVEQIIEFEKTNNPDIKYLNTSHSKLIAQIISNYNLEKSNNVFPSAKMIFLGAPTGAGKDTLVRKILADNETENFVILNMDMFRHYHNEVSENNEFILDKDFAKKTNQTSYEIYYIIQEVILKEYPGTNIIVTGTIRDLDWVKDIINTYKNNTLTNYDTSLITLAVPITESAFSIYERYLNMVDARENSNNPLRYTDLNYHNDTVKEFISNIKYFEDNLNQNPDSSLVSSIKVYRRNTDISNLDEDNLIYDSTKADNSKTAINSIFEIMNSTPTINSTRIIKLLNIVSKNKEYLQRQELYDTILSDLNKIFPQIDKNSLEEFSLN